jgi:DnaB helicase-like protein
MSYFHNEDFQEKMLMFVCRDRTFLKKMAGMLTPEHFKPRKGEGNEEIHIIAELAFKYWKEYREPIGGMLQTECLDYIRQHKRKMGTRLRHRLMDMQQKIKKADGLVAVEAVEKKIAEYLQRQNKARAIKDLIESQEKGELSDSKFQRICRDALEKFTTTLNVSDYTDEDAVEKRIKRREKNRDRKYPYLMIDPLDKMIRTFPRGEVGVLLGKYKLGKSTAATYIDQAFALQGYKVLHFTFEDVAEMVEDRLDASFTGIKMKRLMDKSSKLKRRMRKKLLRMRGQIKIVDATEGEVGVNRIDEIWESYRNQGFEADVIVVDADEGVTPEEKHKGDDAERKESIQLYKSLKRDLAAKRDIWVWVCAQTKRGKSGARKMIVTGDDSATDISKMRRCAMAIGIGDGPEEWGDDSRYLHVAVHRYDRGGRGCPIMGDFSRGIFYSRELTEQAMRDHKDDKDQ